jgi:hypothetical protein
MITIFITYLHSLYNLWKKLFLVYFTPFPETIYNESNYTSNLAFNGIAKGLQKNKKIFWYTNLFVGLLTWNYIYNQPFFINNYIKIILLLVCIYFYLVSYLQTIYLLKYLPQSFFQN